MWIDGRPATGGSILIGARQKGEVQLPFGRYAFVFNAGADPTISLDSAKNEIHFSGVDNPLGVSTTITIPVSTGKTVVLNLVLYAIGEGQNAARIVHYTVS